MYEELLAVSRLDPAQSSAIVVLVAISPLLLEYHTQRHLPVSVVTITYRQVDWSSGVSLRPLNLLPLRFFSRETL